MRLQARHYRLLGVVAFHNRLGKNGQGCWVGYKNLAQASGSGESQLFDTKSDLVRWGYITSERHPMNRRTTVHRIVNTDEDIYQSRHNILRTVRTY
jgi:hypothetical protein